MSFETQRHSSRLFLSLTRAEISSQRGGLIKWRIRTWKRKNVSLTLKTENKKGVRGKQDCLFKFALKKVKRFHCKFLQINFYFCTQRDIFKSAGSAVPENPEKASFGSFESRLNKIFPPPPSPVLCTLQKFFSVLVFFFLIFWKKPPKKKLQER